jgi:pilus assembly protein CpaB
MSKRKIILLGAAFLVALITVFVARSMMGPSVQTASAPTGEPASEVLAAAHDLPIGSLLKDSDLKWISWPVDAQSASLFVKGKVEQSQLVGAVLRQSLRTDQPLMTGEVVKPNEEGFLAAVLQPGMRAMAISIKADADVAGFIFPGDHVDVILTHTLNRKNVPDLSDRHVGETILTDVRVLALDQKSNDQTNEPKIAQLATLEVTPRQAEKLALATQIGAISLALRSLAVSDSVTSPPSPDQIPTADSANAGQIWDSDLSQAYPSPGGTDSLLQKVEIMRGKDTSEQTFERHK